MTSNPTIDDRPLTIDHRETLGCDYLEDVFSIVDCRWSMVGDYERIIPYIIQKEIKGEHEYGFGIKR
jgi:hypothetical protein